MIAARAEIPISSQTNRGRLDTVRFHEVVEDEETGSEVSFEIAFEGQRMRERLNIGGLDRLQRACETMLKKSAAMRGRREKVSVEVCCH